MKKKNDEAKIKKEKKNQEFQVGFIKYYIYFKFYFKFLKIKSLRVSINVFFPITFK